MLLVSAAASVAVGLVRHHHRQQELIKITAIVQLVAGIRLFFFFYSLLDKTVYTAYLDSLFN